MKNFFKILTWILFVVSISVLLGFVESKSNIKTITDIQLKLGDQKIDIVTISRKNNDDKLPYIAEVAKKNGIKL